jgi:50S ribosomal protein L16 3-hydroxylase
MVEDSELCVIKDYQPEITVELKAGDILYLPPEIPHHGISTSDDCVTCSIGLRAPSAAELLSASVEMVAQNLPAQRRLKDAVNSISSDASIGSNEIDYLRQQLQALSQQDDQSLAQLFGKFITGYRLLDEAPEIFNNQNNDSYQKSPFAVFAYYDTADSQALLFVNGESHCTSLELAQAICNQSQFKISELKTLAREPMNDLRLIYQLIDSGAIHSCLK